MKRSSQVALLLMGATGMGAGAYALTSPRSCVSSNSGTPPAITSPANNANHAAPQPCPPGSSYGSRTFWFGRWAHPIFSSGSSATAPNSVAFSNGRSSASGGPVAGSNGSSSRGGFGGTGSAMSAGS